MAWGARHPRLRYSKNGAASLGAWGRVFVRFRGILKGGAAARRAAGAPFCGMAAFAFAGAGPPLVMSGWGGRGVWGSGRLVPGGFGGGVLGGPRLCRPALAAWRGLGVLGHPGGWGGLPGGQVGPRKIRFPFSAARWGVVNDFRAGCCGRLVPSLGVGFVAAEGGVCRLGRAFGSLWVCAVGGFFFGGCWDLQARFCCAVVGQGVGF